MAPMLFPCRLPPLLLQLVQALQLLQHQPQAPMQPLPLQLLAVAMQVR